MSQSSQFHEVYAHMRDNKRGAERAALGDALERADRVADALREKMRELDNPTAGAPSKAHLKRIARAGKGAVPAPRAYPEPDADARARLDFHNAMIAQLGGSRTVKAAEGCENLPYMRHYAGGRDELGHIG